MSMLGNATPADGGRRRLRRALIAVGLAVTAIAGPVGMQRASAFSASNTINLPGGDSWSLKASSCNLYWSSCSYSSSVYLNGYNPVSANYTHYANVHQNSLSASLTISASPSGTITGSHSNLVTWYKSYYGWSSSVSGQANPSIFSISVGARTRVTSCNSIYGCVDNNSGWTTW